MADTVTTKWVYPPNFDGYYPNPKVGHKRHTIRLTNLSDGTGESAVIKITRADLLTSKGNIPSKLVVEKINYRTFGMGVRLYYDTTPDEVIAYLAESQEGNLDWTKSGGLSSQNEGGTGNILLTTANATSGDTYDITITIRLKD